MHESRRPARPWTGLSTLSGVGLCVLLSLRPAAADDTDVGIRRVVTDYAAVVHASYRSARDDAVELARAIDRFLEHPDPAMFEQVRRAWIVARRSYGQTEVFRFYGGPIDRVDPVTHAAGPELHLNAWPVDEAYIDYVRGCPACGIINDPGVPIDPPALRSRNTLDDETQVSTGYHAVEFLLWGQDFDTAGPGRRPVIDYSRGTPANDRRRRYLAVVAAMIVEDLNQLVVAWAPGERNYRVEFLGDEHTAFNHILTGMIQLAGFELSMERLAVPLDSHEQEDEHSCFSDNTHNDFIANVEGLHNVYYGRAGPFAGRGVHDYLTGRQPELDRLIEERLRAIDSAVRTLPHPFDQLIGSPPGSRARAQAEQLVRDLQMLSELLKVVRATAMEQP